MDDRVTDRPDMQESKSSDGERKRERQLAAALQAAGRILQPKNRQTVIRAANRERRIITQLARARVSELRLILMEVSSACCSATSRLVNLLLLTSCGWLVCVCVVSEDKRVVACVICCDPEVNSSKVVN